jgi:hypothetical protein
MDSLPRGLRRLIRNKQEDLGDQVEKFIDFEKGLHWTFGVVGHEDKRQTVEGPTQVLVKLPLDKSMTKDETQVAWN